MYFLSLRRDTVARIYDVQNWQLKFNEVIKAWVRRTGTFFYSATFLPSDSEQHT